MSANVTRAEPLTSVPGRTLTYPGYDLPVAIAVRAVSVAVVVMWIVAFTRIDERAVKGRTEGKAVALAFIGLGVAGFCVSFLIPS